MPPAPLIPFFWAPGWNSVQSINKYQVEVGGPLRGGDPGKRLFPKTPAIENVFLNNIPPAFLSSPGEWMMIPMPHIFGSEELSIYTHGIAEQSPLPYIAISKQDAKNLNAGENEIIQVQIQDRNYALPVRIKEELQDGLAGIPFNLPGLSGIAWPAKGILKNAAL